MSFGARTAERSNAWGRSRFEPRCRSRRSSSHLAIAATRRRSRVAADDWNRLDHTTTSPAAAAAATGQRVTTNTTTPAATAATAVAGDTVTRRRRGGRRRGVVGGGRNAITSRGDRGDRQDRRGDGDQRPASPRVTPTPASPLWAGSATPIRPMRPVGVVAGQGLVEVGEVHPDLAQQPGRPHRRRRPRPHIGAALRTARTGCGSSGGRPPSAGARPRRSTAAGRRHRRTARPGRTPCTPCAARCPAGCRRSLSRSTSCSKPASAESPCTVTIVPCPMLAARIAGGPLVAADLADRDHIGPGAQRRPASDRRS